MIRVVFCFLLLLILTACLRNFHLMNIRILVVSIAVLLFMYCFIYPGLSCSHSSHHVLSLSHIGWSEVATPFPSITASKSASVMHTCS
jgi:hypothetical protein